MFRFSMAKAEHRVAAECERLAFEAYKRDYAGGSNFELEMALNVLECETKLVRKRNGNILVTVSVYHSDDWRSAHYCFACKTIGRKCRITNSAL